MTEVTVQTSHPNTLSIVNLKGEGRTISLKLPWGKERRLLKLVGELFASIPTEITFGVHSSDNPGLALLQYITTEAPEKITHLVAMLLDEKPEAIDENYDGDAIIDFAVPFITQYAAKWGERLKDLPLAQMFGAQASASPDEQE